MIFVHRNETLERMSLQEVTADADLIKGYRF